jgi:hypothetical protein
VPSWQSFVDYLPSPYCQDTTLFFYLCYRYTDIPIDNKRLKTLIQQTRKLNLDLHPQCRGWKSNWSNVWVFYQKWDGNLCTKQPACAAGGSTYHYHVCVSRPSKKCQSENATRSIFGLLLLKGYPPMDREIQKHEWVEIYDSDEEELHDNNSGSGSKLSLSTPNVEVWIAEV